MPCLRLDAFIEMIVAGEDHAHVVFHEQRFENRPQRQIRTVSAAGGVERVMKVGDLPIAPGSRQFLLQPGKLGLVHIVAVEREKADPVARLEREVALSAQIACRSAD